MSVDAARDHRASIEKAISLLVSLSGDAQDGLGVSELARRAGLSKSTAFRVLRLLERHGLVQRNGPQYELGTFLYELGQQSRAPHNERVRDLLIPHLTELFSLTGETVHLAVLSGTDVVYLAKLYGHRHLPTPSRIGSRIPAFTTAVGKSLLAHDHEAFERVLRQELTPRTPYSAVDPKHLQRLVSQVREDGVAFDREESVTGLSCVAMPILGAARRPVAAISISGRPDRVEHRSQIAHLRRVAATATQAVLRSCATGMARTAG